MSMSVVERFWVRLATDEPYREEFRAALPEHPEPEDLADFARKTGFDVSADQLVHHARHRTVHARALEDDDLEDDDELSDEMLEGVAGGGSADSYASDQLEMDIYATWDGLGADPTNDPLAGKKPSAPPAKP